MIERRWVNRGAPNYPFTLNWESSQARGLVAWWPTLSSSGARDELRDRFRNFNLSLDSPPTWVSSSLGQVIFYNNGPYGVIENPIFTTFPVTISLWNQDTMTGANKFYLGQWDSALGGGFTAISTTGSSGFVRIWTGGGVEQGNTYVINDGIPHNICVVWASATDRKIYVDGRLDNSFTPSKILTATANRFSVGMARDSTPSGGITSNLGDIRIYDIALTPIEVYQLYAPQTRWELYQPIQRDAFAFVAAAGLGPVYPGRNHPSRNVLLRL